MAMLDNDDDYEQQTTNNPNEDEGMPKKTLKYSFGVGVHYYAIFSTCTYIIIQSSMQPHKKSSGITKISSTSLYIFFLSFKEIKIYFIQ